MAAILCWSLIKKRRDWLLLVTFAIFLVCFLINLLAPGNTNRVVEGRGGLVTALVSGVWAIAKAARVQATWLTLPLLFASAAVAPISWKFARRTNFPFRYPPLVMLASLLLLAAGLFPMYYTTGNNSPDRLMNTQYYLFVILLFANVYYGVGWLFKHMPEGVFDKIAMRSRSAIAACIAVMGLMASAGYYDAFASYDAMKTLISGEASAYYAESMANIVILEDPDIRDAVLRPVENVPPMLSFGGISADENWHINIHYCWYYQKDSVRTLKQNP
jgi:hypothetical protein